MSRKTINVKALRDRINGMILNSADSATGERIALALVIEGVLMDTGNYSGFGYLDAKDMENSDMGTTVGINREAKVEDQFKGTDQTRVHYY